MADYNVVSGNNIKTPSTCLECDVFCYYDDVEDSDYEETEV